jgi:hypothetical protein
MACRSAALAGDRQLMASLQVWLDGADDQGQTVDVQQQQSRRKGVVLATGQRQLWLDAHYVRELILAQQILGAQAQSLHHWSVMRWRDLPVPLVSRLCRYECPPMICGDCRTGKR